MAWVVLQLAVMGAVSAGEGVGVSGIGVSSAEPLPMTGGTVEVPSVVLTRVEGIDVNGKLIPGADMKFVFWIANPKTCFNLMGYCLGFRLFSPDEATWQPVVLDTLSVGWMEMFNIGIFINYFSANGSGADTAYIAGAAMPDCGRLP